MKIYNNISFAKQLIIYLILVLSIAFLFISLALTNSVQQFIRNNAYSRAQILSTNVKTIFEREISKIENIPNKVTEIYGHLNPQNASALPVKILKSYSILNGCTIYYNPEHPSLGHLPSTTAYRLSNGEIRTDEVEAYSSCKPAQIIQRKPHGLWMRSEINHSPAIAYYQCLYDEQQLSCGMLRFDFAIESITNLICDYKLYKSGILFIIDDEGNYITHTDTNVLKQQHILHPVTCQDTTLLNISRKVMKGETGSTIFFKDNIKYFIYYTPIRYLNWRLGMICPYSEVLSSSNKLYWLIFLCLGAGLLFLFIGTVNIVHRLSNPLKQLAYTARQIAHGRFDVVIPEQNSSHEINELYNSFRYMQQSLIHYIERLKASTAAREQINTEINLAQKIQQGLLRHTDLLPDNIELKAELLQSRMVGGDLYEYFITGHNLYFAIGDVSGKGIPAALYMASFCKLFRYVASCYHSTATICNIINKQMCDNEEDDMYITLFTGILDINTGIMKYTNAGHPYPLIIHENGLTNLLNKYPEVPIGIMEDHYFTEHTYTFRRNTSLLLYTDGVYDAENSAGEFYGKERMIECIENLSERSPAKVVEALLEDIFHHLSNRSLSDDLTLLDICYRGIPQSVIIPRAH